MGIVSLRAADSHFRDAGTSALAYFLGLQAGSLKCTLTDAISASSISLLMARIWEKPTAHSSWEVESVNGKPELCANTTRSRRRLPDSSDNRLAHASRTKLGVDANAETQRFVKWNVGVSGIANERRSIQQKSSNA